MNLGDGKPPLHLVIGRLALKEDGAHARIRTAGLLLTKWSADPGEFGLILAPPTDFSRDHLPQTIRLLVETPPLNASTRRRGLRVFRHGVSGRIREDQRVSIELRFMTQPSHGVSRSLRESPGQGVK